ncbi:hypothetical protein Ancab_000984 [Ancistrocladus abbreviatus]
MSAWAELCGSGNFFKRLALRWGDCVDIDKNTIERSRFDYARFAVHTLTLDCLRESLQIKVDNEPVTLNVIEETTGAERCFEENSLTSKASSEATPSFSISAVADSVEVAVAGDKANKTDGTSAMEVDQKGSDIEKNSMAAENPEHCTRQNEEVEDTGGLLECGYSRTQSGTTSPPKKTHNKPDLGQSLSGVSITDSQIMNRNKLLCAAEDRTDDSCVQPSPKQIWDFLTRIAIEQENGEEEMVRRIKEMEQRDAAMFAEMMQKEGENENQVSNCPQ